MCGCLGCEWHMCTAQGQTTSFLNPELDSTFQLILLNVKYNHRTELKGTLDVAQPLPWMTGETGSQTESGRWSRSHSSKLLEGQRLTVFPSTLGCYQNPTCRDIRSPLLGRDHIWGLCSPRNDWLINVPWKAGQCGQCALLGTGHRDFRSVRKTVCVIGTKCFLTEGEQIPGCSQEVKAIPFSARGCKSSLMVLLISLLSSFLRN